MGEVETKEKTVRECPFRKGRVEKRRVEHVHRWGEKLYLLRNVPAEVCTQCGEVFLGPDALEQMDRVVTGAPPPESHVSVPVYSLS